LGDLDRDLVGEQFGHRRLVRRCRNFVVSDVRRPQVKHPGGVDLCGHLGQLASAELMAVKLCPALDPGSAPVAGHLERKLGAEAGPLSHLVGDRPAGDAGTVEGDHETGEPGRARVTFDVALHAREFGDLAVGDELLGPGKHVAVGLPAGLQHALGMNGIVRNQQVTARLVLGDGIARKYRLGARKTDQKASLKSRIT
jgi:hypothetical protein